MVAILLYVPTTTFRVSSCFYSVRIISLLFVLTLSRED